MQPTSQLKENLMQANSNVSSSVNTVSAESTNGSIPRSKTQHSTNRQFVGSALAMLAIGVLAVLLAHSPEAGGGVPVMAMVFAVGCIALRQQRQHIRLATGSADEVKD